MHYQDINEILAKGVNPENMSPDYIAEINSANEYLLDRRGRKPEWLEGFFESNRCKLIETICRATAMPQGISSLQGYSEGYFNEIIQNANDRHCGNSIRFDVDKAGRTCRFDCEYEDRGFELSNIYAFLNREMSDKTDDESQTGKFGVGIKSLFKFVDRLSITSNVIFDFQVERTEKDTDVSGIAAVNPEWPEKKTVLSITYDSEYESGFNTAKLTSLAGYLCEGRNSEVLNFFGAGSDSELVFDIRSLIFMHLNARNKKNISRMEFCGGKHSVRLYCEEESKISTVSIGEENWRTGVLRLGIMVDGDVRYEKRYVVFSSAGISVALPEGEFSEEQNRMYSTYYLKADDNSQLLPIGMLIDSKYANIHRNDVGDSEDKIKDVYEKVRGYMKGLYGFMCSKEAAELSCASAISDVFHSIVARYLMSDPEEYTETPLRDAYFDNSALPKMLNGTPKAYVVAHEQKEAYDSASYQEGEIVQELRENYFDFVEKKNTYDLRELLSKQDTIFGVKKLYNLMSDPENLIPADNRKAAAAIANYFASVAEFLAYEIAQEHRKELLVSDAEIDSWLLRLQEECGKYFNASMFLKLVGRYRLNDAIAYDGSIKYANLSFKDYLFNGALVSSNGLLAQYQNKFFDDKYYKLKQELLEKRYQDTGNINKTHRIRCIRPIGRSITGWDGMYDYYGMYQSPVAMERLSEPQLLLERMATDEKFTGLQLSGSELRLFETRARGMWRRDYQFKNYVIDEQQIIQLSCLKNIRLDSFVDFINAVKYRSQLPDELQKFIHISCREESISTKAIIENVLPVMIEPHEDDGKKYLLDEFEPADIEIVDIQEASNDEMPSENAEFVSHLTGYRVHIYRFISNTQRKILAYFGNGKCAIKTDASKKYREVAHYNSADKNIYIFYDNVQTDLQQAVTNVLNEIGISTKNQELLEGYIHNGNTTKTMSYMSRRRNIAKIKRNLALDWADVDDGEMLQISDTEILYRLLTARGGYDIYCPICADIPLEAFDYGEDTKKKHSRKIILMENDNPETMDAVPYIITVGCSYCCQRLRNTLIRSEFDGKNLILTTQIAHGLHEKTRSKQVIELSPINIEVMKRFKV